MERTNKTMIALMTVALTFCACSSEDGVLSGNESNTNCARLVTLTAYQENTTRAKIDDDERTQIDWTSGDKINYFGGGSGEYLTLDGEDGYATGTFSGTVTAGTTDYVLYPYNADATCNDGTITTTIPSKQIIPQGSFDPEAGIMVGQVKGSDVQFYNAVGYLAITIPYDESYKDKITKMVITGNNNERLSGNITISGMSTSAAPVSIAGTKRTITDAESPTGVIDGVKYIEILPANVQGVQQENFMIGGTYYVAVAPDANLSKGIYVLLYNGTTSEPSTLKLAVKKTSANINMTRAKVSKITLPTVSSWTPMIALKDAAGNDNGLYMSPFNLGATSTSGTAAYGNYYSFGEIDTKSSYVSSAYKGSANLTGLTDAATSNWGSDWRMPTYEEFLNNMSSLKDLPLAGNYFGTALFNDPKNGMYRSSSVASESSNYYLCVPDPVSIGCSSDYTIVGLSVRAVLK